MPKEKGGRMTGLASGIKWNKLPLRRLKGSSNFLNKRRRCNEKK